MLIMVLLFSAGVVETLVKTGRHIDAVHFAFAFHLTETFPPVPLLKEYLNNVKGNAQENSGDAAATGGQVGISNLIISYYTQDKSTHFFI